ncbi:MAG: DUF1572 family protein [Lewinellaceae bacterium]|jgi:uncharacterized damage-inducible protein DinB|nr:DUF1572 family protein [Lewinellaceae bacterium]
MLKNALIEIFERDLRQVAREINLYADESDLWVVKAEISNSAGNLCLHLIGNLNHFIGAVLGNTGYVREREREFSDKNVPRADLLLQLEKTISVVTEALRHLPDPALNEDFPVDKRGQIVKTDFMLLHLLGHLSYHLGQINYHRRLI